MMAPWLAAPAPTSPRRPVPSRPGPSAWRKTPSRIRRASRIHRASRIWRTTWRTWTRRSFIRPTSPNARSRWPSAPRLRTASSIAAGDAHRTLRRLAAADDARPQQSGGVRGGARGCATGERPRAAGPSGPGRISRILPAATPTPAMGAPIPPKAGPGMPHPFAPAPAFGESTAPVLSGGPSGAFPAPNFGESGQNSALGMRQEPSRHPACPARRRCFRRGLALPAPVGLRCNRTRASCRRRASRRPRLPGIPGSGGSKRAVLIA